LEVLLEAALGDPGLTVGPAVGPDRKLLAHQ
jgi:hypothetical protein